MIPERRSILTIEMAMTALAAVSRKTRTACLNSDVYMGVSFDVCTEAQKKGCGISVKISRLIMRVWIELTFATINYLSLRESIEENQTSTQ